MANRTCANCGSNRFSVFHEMTSIPVYVGALWRTKEQAVDCPKGAVALAHCEECGFIGNVAFVPELVDYDMEYDNALHFSNVFQSYERELAAHLIDQYDIRNKRVLEIGCGSGHFLGLICELGNNRGVGFEPSHRPERADPLAKKKVDFIADYYSEQHPDVEADLLCCRHVLEHIERPAEFLQLVRRAVMSRPDTVIYFEVPNARLILDDLSIWDIMYEHCNYFTRESLGYLFEANGFEILDLRESYEGQFLSIEAISTDSPRVDPVHRYGDLVALARSVERFAERFAATKDEWQARLREMESMGTQAVIWGAGGKTVSFLNMLEIGDLIEYVVDVNPGKQGTFIGGAGQAILPPKALKEIQPRAVIVPNPIYKEEISVDLQDMGLHPDVLTP